MNPQPLQSNLHEYNKAWLQLKSLCLLDVEHCAKKLTLQSIRPSYRYKPVYFHYFASYMRLIDLLPQCRNNRLSNLNRLCIFKRPHSLLSCFSIICSFNTNSSFQIYLLFPLTIHIQSVFEASHIAWLMRNQLEKEQTNGIFRLLLQLKLSDYCKANSTIQIFRLCCSILALYRYPFSYTLIGHYLQSTIRFHSRLLWWLHHLLPVWLISFFWSA